MKQSSSTTSDYTSFYKTENNTVNTDSSLNGNSLTSTRNDIDTSRTVKMVFSQSLDFTILSKLSAVGKWSSSLFLFPKH